MHTFPTKTEKILGDINTLLDKGTELQDEYEEAELNLEDCQNDIQEAQEGLAKLQKEAKATKRYSNPKLGKSLKPE